MTQDASALLKLADRIEGIDGLGVLCHVDDSGQLDTIGALSGTDKEIIVAALRQAASQGSADGYRETIDEALVGMERNPMNYDREMQRALELDGEKLRQITGEDHGPQTLIECGQCCGDSPPVKTGGGEAVAWLYEINVDGTHWSQRYTDTKPAGNSYQRNIRPLYLASPRSEGVRACEVQMKRMHERLEMSDPPAPAQAVQEQRGRHAVERFQKRVVEMVRDGCVGFHFSSGPKWRDLTIEEKCAAMLEVWDAKGIPLDFKDSCRTSTVSSAQREYDPNVAPCDDAEFWMKP